MGQKLSKKVLQRHLKEADAIEKILQCVFLDESLRLSVLTGTVMNDPLEVMGDFIGSVKYLLIHNPVTLERQNNNQKEKKQDEEKVEEEEEGGNSGPTWREVSPIDRPASSQVLQKKVLDWQQFQRLRRICLEYEKAAEARAHSPRQGQISEIETTALTTSECDNMNLPQMKVSGKQTDSFDNDECSICMDASIDIVLPCLHGYCSSCWDDWSSQNSTCPHCRGEVNQSPGGGGGPEDIWQFESWNESDIQSQLETLTQKLREFVTTLPVDLTREMMSCHRVLTRQTSYPESIGSSSHSCS